MTTPPTYEDLLAKVATLTEANEELRKVTPKYERALGEVRTLRGALKQYCPQVLSFGKYQGRHVRRVPTSYLLWVHEHGSDRTVGLGAKDAIYAELASR